MKGAMAVGLTSNPLPLFTCGLVAGIRHCHSPDAADHMYCSKDSCTFDIQQPLFSVSAKLSYPSMLGLLSNVIFCCGQFCIFLVLCSFRMCAVYSIRLVRVRFICIPRARQLHFSDSRHKVMRMVQIWISAGLRLCVICGLRGTFLRGHRTQFEHRGTHTSGRTHQPTLHPRTEYQIHTIQFIHFSICPLHRCEAGSESRKHCGSELQERKNSCTTKHQRGPVR